MYTEYMYKDSLTHFGIQEMKWGVRRYQNEDGTLTPEGMRRYGVDYNKRGTKQIIADQYGKKMKRRDRRYMEKQMIKSLKKANTKESREQLAQYKKAKKNSKTGVTYIGSSPLMALGSYAFNAATEGKREQGKMDADRMIANYANKYLSDLEKSGKKSTKKKKVDK